MMARRAKANKANIAPNGRSLEPKGGRFTRLPHDVQNSPAFRALSPTARAVLLELISLDRGQNNGLLFLSERDAADRIGIRSEKTVRLAFAELLDTGLIICTGNAYFNIKAGDGRARRWALTWLFDYANRKPACNIWRTYKPNGSTVQRVASGMKAIKRYKRNIPKDCDDELNHAGKIYRFDPENPDIEANHLPVKNTGLNYNTAENRNFCDTNLPVNITDYTAVTRGKVQQARWEERPRGDKEGSVRQYIWASPKLAA